jgi:ParB family chromosome partitioning protein
MEISLQRNFGELGSSKMSKKSLSSSVASKPTGSAFNALSSALGAGMGNMMNSGEGDLADLRLDQIYVGPQIRVQFEDELNSNAEMDASVSKHGVFQSILVRPTPDGPREYALVAGERRYRSSERTGKTTIPALIREMTEEEAVVFQMQENIQRKNLTQIEIAKRLQADLEEAGGSVEAVMAKNNKSRAWVSKWLALTTLDEQATRVIAESISSDLEVIGMVKTVENLDPVAAAQMVDELKETRGKQDAREVAAKHKEIVKPSKKDKSQKQGEKATAKDQAAKQPGAVTSPNFAEAKILNAQPDSEPWPFPDHYTEHASTQTDTAPTAALAATQEQESGADEHRAPTGLGPAFPPSILTDGYELILTKGLAPKEFLASLSEQEKSDVQEWLESFYIAGRDSKNIALGLIQGLRQGTFSQDGAGAFAMLAFIQGGDSSVTKFDTLNVLGLAKP